MTQAGADLSGSPDRFGYEWAEYAELRPVYEEQFLRWTALIARQDWRGKCFLDVGCGMGRNSHWPMTYGASGGAAIDVDDRSLASAKRTLARWPTIEVRKMSAYAIDFDGAFDFVFSIGVIHHLADPQAALRQITKAAKPGGKVMIWVYGYENNEWIVRWFDPLRKLVFARLPIGVTHFLSLFPTILLWTRCGSASAASSISICCEGPRSGRCAASCSTRCCRGSRTTGGATRSKACSAVPG